MSKPAGVTYVITNPEYQSVKIGCTSTRSNRIDYLLRRGWQMHQYLILAAGRLARQVEQEALFEIRHRLYVPPHLTEAELPDGGWTETSSLSLISARTVWDIACEQAGRIQLNPTVHAQTMRKPPPHRRTKGDTQPYSSVARIMARLERTEKKDSL